jgi:hypothetical protein
MPTSNVISKPTPGYEVVFTVRDYHDAPRSGVANFHGTPHFYQCIFDVNRDDYSNSYRLIPLNQDVFQAAIENWEIFLRWRAAFDLGKVNRKTHPALPQDKKRYEETKQILDLALEVGRDKVTHVEGEFDVLGDPKLPHDVLTPWQVKWSKP